MAWSDKARAASLEIRRRKGADPSRSALARAIRNLRTSKSAIAKQQLSTYRTEAKRSSKQYAFEHRFLSKHAGRIDPRVNIAKLAAHIKKPKLKGYGYTIGDQNFRHGRK